MRDASEQLPRFLESMPERYREQISSLAAADHAELAATRNGKLVSVGRFTCPNRDGYGICVIANDGLGLLALISASLVLCALDVLEAEAYTRRNSSGNTEAIDLFWVRHAYPRADEPLTDWDMVELEETLEDLLSGKERPSISQRRPDSLTPSATETSVRFIEDGSGSVVTLEVETRDRSGLLLAVTEALFREKVQIVGSHIRTYQGRVKDRFDLVESNGSPILRERRHTLQLAVLAAVDHGGSTAVASATP